MSWRVANVSGTIQRGTWRIAKVSGSVTTTTTSWRIAKVSGLLAALSTWRITRVSGAVVLAGAGPVLAAIPTQTADPVQLVTIVAQVTNGVTPDSYTFTSPGITFTVTGNTATFISPGSPTGGTVTVTVSALKAGLPTGTQTASVLVNAALGGYLAADQTIHGISYPYQA